MADQRRMDRFHPDLLTSLKVVLVIPVLLLFATKPEIPSDTRYGAELAEGADAERLREWHDMLGSEPHVAGTPGDHRAIARMKSAFESMGLQTDVNWFHALLPSPRKAQLEIIGSRPLSRDVEALDGPRQAVVPLPLKEKNLLEDPASAHPGLTYGWNAFSGSGDVTAEVVYANYGTLDDFRRLEELGVDVKGKIVIARYGRNYRGYKVKYAQEAGAVGLLMFLDPADYGYERGETWPSGGWANESCIQRGSVLVLPYKGDPLTPFVEATENAERLAVDDVNLPRIPVQPIGYAAANRIIARMDGRPLEDESWQGGLPVDYRLEGGAELKVRLAVEQDRRIRRSANVLASIQGESLPDEFIVVGCHHDAWGFGAADPLAGTIVLMETARLVAEAASRGERPARTIIFAAWGAEEFGIIGSTEWVEGNRERLLHDCVAYLNLDMAAMGDNFSASASPVLRKAVAEALLPVAQSGVEDATLAQTWAAGENGPTFGDLGGGSDHVGFVCHVGVPAIRLGAGGAPGVAYHSNYDTLDWYRSIVGDDYDSALMVTRAASRVVGMLADSVYPPYDWNAVAKQLSELAEQRLKEAHEVGLKVDLAGFTQAMGRLDSAAEDLAQRLADHPSPQPALRRQAGSLLLAAERSWLLESGLPDRPWYRNTYVSDDPTSGYSASLLPLLQSAVRAQAESEFSLAVSIMALRTDDLADQLEGLVRIIDRNKSASSPL